MLSFALTCAVGGMFSVARGEGPSQIKVSDYLPGAGSCVLDSIEELRIDVIRAKSSGEVVLAAATSADDVSVALNRGAVFLTGGQVSGSQFSGITATESTARGEDMTEAFPYRWLVEGPYFAYMGTGIPQVDGGLLKVNRDKIRANGGKTVDLVMLGDSISHYWPVNGPVSWAAFNEGRRVFDFGEGSDRVQDTLYVAKWGYLDGYEAKNVSIMVGVNNIRDNASAAAIAGGIETLIGVVRAKQPNARILLHAVLPYDVAGSAVRAKVAALNALLQPLADGERIVWIDMASQFVNDDGTFKSGVIKSDNIHPAEAGYAIWSGVLQEFVEPTPVETLVEEFSDDNIVCADGFVRAIQIGNRTAYVFTKTTSEAIDIAVKRDVTIEQLLVVGGGGAGGYHFGGGGGGGGVVYEPNFARFVEGGETLAVQVGAGGTGKQDRNWHDPGKASWFAIGAATNMAYGGGSGGNYDVRAATTGKLGSGGGGNGQGDGTTYTSAQGNAGGVMGSGTTGGGGGGGASEPGENGGKADEEAGYTRGGNGGEGRTINITGKDVVYGSGGGGGGRPGGNKAKAGKGGTNAADGWWNPDFHAGIAAPDGFGGGGGGASYGAGGNGGSGTVILLVAAGDVRQYSFTVLPIPDQLYLGTPLQPEPVVSNMFTGAILEKNRDYTVDYEDNSLEPGELTGRGTVIVRGMAGTGFDGKVEMATFGMTSAYQFEIAPIPDQLYAGAPVTPEPALTNAILGVTPVKGSDYRLEYENNDAVGTATVRAIGLGKYAGCETERTFTLLAPAFVDGNIQASSATTFEKRMLNKRAVYIFTNVTEDTLLYVNHDITIEKMLVVGGGGGGGGTMGAGGGAGGLIYFEDPTLVRGGAQMTVSVGNGGAGAMGHGTSGGNSSILGMGASIVALGGGGGGTYSDHNGLPGGSGGGGSQAGGKGGAGTPGQGFAGGEATVAHFGGGGGGAGGPGKSTADGRWGGPGVTSDITGELLEYARGGKGCGHNVDVPYEPAGVDGRGDGGGGGGQLGPNYSGTRGGNGTVILYVADHDTVNFRYAIASPGEQVYLGEPVHPKPTVRNVVTGAVLTEGVDFTYAYENCDTYGRGRVIANGVDGSDYDGAYATAEFDIVNGFLFAVEPIPRQAFVGGPVRPSVTVVNTVVGGVLSEDRDYVVTYENNEGLGQARAIVSGKTGTGYEGVVVTNGFVIGEAYADEFVYVADTSVRSIDDGARKVYVFTNTENVVALNFRKNMTLVECLVVGGGGGGGGFTMSAGGGAGGYVASSNKFVLTENNSIVISVGKGGDVDKNGTDSLLAIGAVSLTAKGGGYGANNTSFNGGDGGSGGGSYWDGMAGKGMPGQGYGGGVSGKMNFGGGGGGAGGPGKSYAEGRWGGVGITNAITGTAIEYARGGKGCGYDLGIVREPAGTDGLGEGGGGGGKIGGSNYGGSRGGNGTVILALKEGGALGQPEFGAEGIEIEFLHETSIPQARVTLAGDEDAIYQASVTLEFGAEEGVYTSSKTFEGLLRGDEVTFRGDVVLREGETLYVRATVSAQGAADRTLTKSVTVPYDRPAWYGKGGGEGIIHVRSGAFGNDSGSDWMNAIPDVRAALKLLSTTKDEVWIADDWMLTDELVTTTLTAPAKIRGGFTGTENALAERSHGARSVLDGGDAQNILRVAGNYLLTLDSIEFTRAKSRAVERSGGALFVTNCNFEANGTTVEQVSGRALSASGSASVTAEFVDTRFAKNTEKGTSASGGACIMLSSFMRATFDNCMFMTNGIIPNVNSGTKGFGEGGNCKGATLNVSGVPLTMRNCRFLGNKAACRGMTASGGTVRLFEGSYPSAFTNCLFVGNSERQPHSDASETSDYAGAIVVELNSAEGRVEFDTCTFAWNLADCRSSPAAINVRKGAVKVRNSIFWGNKRRDIDTAGVDIEVKADGSADVDYSLFAATNETCITTADATKLTLGEHIVCGSPKFVTRDEDLAGIVKTNKSTYNFIYFDWNRLDELVGFNAHLRGGRYVDEATGEEVYKMGASPAIDTGDPAHDWSNEPRPNGRRVNMGFYGNTPWASCSKPGMMLIVR